MNLQTIIENSTGASEHLDFAQRLISQNEIDEDTRKYLVNEMNRVKTRLQDENLYVAVVGGASTGKSTFINALLGAEILKSKSLTKTTSAATYLCYGDNLSVGIRFHETQTNLSDFARKGKLTFTAKHEPITISELPGIRNLTLLEFIHHLTTRDDVAEKLSHIAITYPSLFLKLGVVVVDTPGVNVKQDNLSGQNHKEITVNAVKNADALLIITSATQVTDKWVLDALEEPDFLQPFLHRCVFLITQMDWLRSMDRKSSRDQVTNSIYQEAVTRLQARLKTQDLSTSIKVFTCAAQAVVDTFSGEEPQVVNEEERIYWQKEFSKLEGILHEFLMLQRSYAISESVLNLLNSLLTSLEDHTKRVYHDYEDRYSQLEDIWKDIDGFCATQIDSSKQKMKKVWSNATDKIEILVGKERDAALSNLRQAMNACTNVDELQNFAKYKASSILSTSEKKIVSSIETNINTINSEAHSISRYFEQEFKVLYERLKLLSASTITSNSVSINLPKYSNVSSLAGSSALEDNTGANLVGGAVIGGVIGSVIPVIGTFVGAVIGGVIGSWFGPSIDDRKRDLWTSLQPRVLEYYTQIKDNSTTSIKKYGKDLTKKIESHVENHANAYRTEVNRIRESQLRERENIVNMQEKLKQDLLEIASHREKISKKQSNLKKKIESQT